MSEATVLLDRPAEEPTGTRSNGRVAAIGLLIFAIATNVVVLTGFRLPFIGPLAGFLLLVGVPTWMVYLKVDWQTAEPAERVGYSLVLSILLLLVVGLFINTALPLVGIRRSLDRIPVLIAVDCLCLGLALWRRERWRGVHLPDFVRAPGRSGRITLILSAFTVPMATVGAVRLNNGASGAVTFAMLIVAAVTMVLLLRWRESLHPSTIAAAIYLVALALLLMTSLRGWYTTGHDIQREFRVFQLTSSHGNWNISRFKDAYNACLSITILPTMISRLTGVADVNVYKVFFQILFAFCPVLLYRIARRYASTGIALLAVIYFISFPTYFSDMPFLNRQEIAFLFVAVAVLIISDASVTIRKRRVLFGVFSVGVVFSHYSTAYLLLGTFGVAWVAGLCLPVLAAVLRRTPARLKTVQARIGGPKRVMVIGLANLAVIVLALGLWNGAATQTTNGLSTTISGAVKTLRGSNSADSKSSDVSYNLFSTHKPSEQERLNAYATSTLERTDGRADDDFFPQTVLAGHPTQVIPAAELPPTAPGRLIESLGLNVSSLNAAVRLGSAKLLQLFVGLGLLAVAFSKRRYLRTGAEFYLLGVAAFFIVLLQVVLPVLSVQYGVLRAFLQALLILGPFVAVGSLALFSRLGDRWSFRVASAIAVLFFLSLSGVIPQALGGYPPQLNLNNAGEYYDTYYVHAQDAAGIAWLQQHDAADLANVQSEVVSDRYTFPPVSTFASTNPSNGIYPTLLRRGAWVFLGYSTVRNDQAAVSYAGDVLTYRYPTALLDQTKNLIYASDGVRIYR